MALETQSRNFFLGLSSGLLKCIFFYVGDRQAVQHTRMLETFHLVPNIFFSCPLIRLTILLKRILRGKERAGKNKGRENTFGAVKKMLNKRIQKPNCSPPPNPWTRCIFTHRMEPCSKATFKLEHLGESTKRREHGEKSGISEEIFLSLFISDCKKWKKEEGRGGEKKREESKETINKSTEKKTNWNGKRTLTLNP